MTSAREDKVVYGSGAGLPFSAAIRAGDFVYVSGQIAMLPDGSVSTGPIEEQTRIVLKGIEATLKEAGCALSDVINCSCSLQDARDFSGFNKAYASFFPTAPPTRTTLVVTHVLDAKVEIGCVAYQPLR